MVHIYSGMLLSHIKEQWYLQQQEIIILRKSERERQIPHDVTYMWSLKYDTNEPMYETETLRENRLISKGEEGGGGIKWEVGVSRCKLSYMEWINKVLLYSPEKYIFSIL